MSTHIDHHFRIFGSSKDLKQVADTVKNLLDLCPDRKCDHSWNIKHEKKKGGHRVDVWLGTTWHDCANLLETVVAGLSASFPNITAEHLRYSDDGDTWSELYSIRKGVETPRGQWSCLLWNEVANALADLKSAKTGVETSLVVVTDALTKLATHPDCYGTITADVLADSVVSAVGRNRNLLDDPAVVKSFVCLGKALAAHGWPSNWFDECDFFDDEDERGPKIPRKFEALLDSVCLSASTTGRKPAATTHPSA